MNLLRVQGIPVRRDTVLREGFAMVARHNDQRIFKNAAAVELSEQFTEYLIEIADGTLIGSQGVGCLLRVLRRGCGHHSWHAPVVSHRCVLRRWPVWLVGIHVVQERKELPVAQPIEPSEELLVDVPSILADQDGGIEARIAKPRRKQAPTRE